MGEEWLAESNRILELGERMRRLIDASDFGPSTDEVLAFLKRLDAFGWEDWRELQKRYVETLELTVRPSLKVLDEAASAAGMSDRIMAAAWAARDKYPTAKYQSRPADINPELCSTACGMCARALAGRTLVPPEDFDRLFLPFTRMQPHAAAGRAGCGTTTLLLVVGSVAAMIGSHLNWA